MLTTIRDYREARDWKRPWLDPPGFFMPDCPCCPAGTCPCTPGTGYYRFIFPERRTPPTTGPFFLEFTASGTWTVPAGTTSVTINCNGGGGGGGGGNAYIVAGFAFANAGGGGGGGGEATTTSYVPTPGDVLTISIVGGPGTGGAPYSSATTAGAGSDGQAGADTSVSKGVTLLCSGGGGHGGHGGQIGANNPGAGGAGGTAFGDITVSGGNGAAGNDGPPIVGGAGGSGGGGAGGGVTPPVPHAGSDGGAATVIIEYYQGGCRNCEFADGFVIGLAPVAGQCKWVNCVSILDDSCDGTHSPITAVLELVGSTMQLTITGDGGQYAIYSLAASAWRCTGSGNAMTLTSESSQCNWPAAIGVVPTDSSVCGVGTYGYYWGYGYYDFLATIDACGCLLPPILYAYLQWTTQPCNVCINNQTVRLIWNSSLGVYAGSSYYLSDINPPGVACDVYITVYCTVISGSINWFATVRVVLDAGAQLFSSASVIPFTTTAPCTPFNAVFNFPGAAACSPGGTAAPVLHVTE